MATVMFEEKLIQHRAVGQLIEEGSDAWLALKASIVPPYDHTKFPNKWRKMEPDRPARTLMAHLGKDGYSHIHYDNAQARTISVREAARLQSFPDGFVFCGTMNPAFRQIGNAVPPLLAKAVASELLAQIRTALAAPARKIAAAGR
jgi:DNA (cytosine-5)-methyltransferase 1